MDLRASALAQASLQPVFSGPCLFKSYSDSVRLSGSSLDDELTLVTVFFFTQTLMYHAKMLSSHT